MRSLGQLAAAMGQVTIVNEDLPLYASLFIGPDAKPSIPVGTMESMYRVLQDMGRRLDDYARVNPAGAPAVRTWIRNAGILMNRTYSGRWTQPQVLASYNRLLAAAKDLLLTPTTWAAYIGPALRERASGVAASIKKGIVAVPEIAVEAAKRAARTAGEMISAFVRTAGLPLLLGGGLGLAALYIFMRARREA